MSSYQELVHILKEILTNRFYPKPEFIKGLLGDGLGNVLVPGRPDFNYVRFNRSANETFEVFNKEVSQPVDGTPVLIGTLPWQPGLVQVVGIDWESYIQTGWGETYASIQAHASTHEWPDFSPGSDWMNVHLRSIYPMRGLGGGTGSMGFTAHPYQYDHTGTNHYWPGTPTVDLGPTRPATGTMRYMGVYLNPASNTLGVVTGVSVPFVFDDEPPYPAWPLNVYPVAFARVYGGQAYFIERDIKDARRLWNTTLVFTGTSAGSGITALTGDVTATGPGSVAATIANDAVTNAKMANMAESTIKGRAAAAGTGDPTDLTAAQVATILAGLLNSWPRPGKVNIGVTEYSSIGAAITAANAGDVLKIGEGTFSETITVNKVLALVALDPNTTIISTSTNNAVPVTVTAAISMINIQCRQTGAGTTGYACEVSTGGSIQAWNCNFNKSSGASTTAAGIVISSAGNTGSRLKYCFAQALAGTTTHGLWASKNAEVFGGRYTGSTASIKVDNSATLDLGELPRLGSTFYDTAAGTILGMFVDSNGELYHLGLTASRAVATDANKKVVSSAVTATELGYVSGVTSAIQTQINNVSVDIGLCEGRLTLTTGVPVTTADVTAATTIYFTPYKGNRVALYTSSVWTLYNFTERSLSLAGLTADKNHDVFLYDNAGTLTLEAVVWTNDSTRATALTTQDGVLVKSGSTNKRYLGTFRTTGTTGQCEDSAGSLAAGGGQAKRFVWNYYNRVARNNMVRDSDNSWTYATAAWRASNNSSTKRISFVVGVSEDAFTAFFNCPSVGNATGSNVAIGVGYDSTTAFTGTTAFNASTSINNALTALATVVPAAGFHYVSAIEYCNVAAAGAGTFYGDLGVPAFIQDGLHAVLWM